MTDPTSTLAMSSERKGERFIRITLKFHKSFRGDLSGIDRVHNPLFGLDFSGNSWPYKEPYPKFSPSNHVSIPPNASDEYYEPPGKCIYCHKEGVVLSKEHIVPEGLGGNLIIPSASCIQCATITGRIEQLVLRNMMWAPRKRLGIKGKNRKRKRDGFPVTTIVGGVEHKFDLPIRDHPTFLIIPVFQCPGHLISRKISSSGFSTVFFESLNKIDAVLDLGFDTIILPEVDLVSFSQMLAKIAHCFAVAELGVDGFISCGHAFSTEKLDSDHEVIGANHYVGGDGRYYAEADELHSLGWHIQMIRGQPWIVVDIRLFANREGFAHQVIAGLLMPEQYNRALSLTKSKR